MPVSPVPQSNKPRDMSLGVSAPPIHSNISYLTQLFIAMSSRRTNSITKVKGGRPVKIDRESKKKVAKKLRAMDQSNIPIDNATIAAELGKRV